MRVSLSNWIDYCNIGIDHTPLYLNTKIVVSCLYAWEYCNKTIQCYFAPWLRLSLVTSKSLYKSSMNPYVDCFLFFFTNVSIKKRCWNANVPFHVWFLKSQVPILFDGYTVIPQKFPQFLMLRWQIPNGLGVGVERSTATGGAWLRLEDLVCSGNSPKMVILWN